MAWWEILDNPGLYQTEGVLLWAGGAAAIILVGGLAIAYVYGAWEQRRKARKSTAAAPARAPPAPLAPRKP